MKFQFAIKFSLFIIMIFNLFSKIICEENDIIPLNDEECLKLTFYYNSTLKKIKLKNNNIKTPFTLASIDKINIYDCFHYLNNSYKSWIEQTKNKEGCLKNNAHDGDNIYCYIEENVYTNGSFYKSYNYCVEVEKSEYERFRKYDYKFDENYNFSNYNEIRNGTLDCYDKIYFQGKYKFIQLFSLFLFFLF